MTASERQVQSNRPKGEQVGKFGDTDIMGRRIIAVIIDTLILIFGISAFAVVTGIGSLSPSVFLPVFLSVIALGQFLYFYLLEGLTGKTVGKFLTRIEVCRENGSQIDFGDSFTRNLWRFVDSVLSYGVGFFVAMSSDEKQRLGDKRANTLVVKR